MRFRFSQRFGHKAKAVGGAVATYLLRTLFSGVAGQPVTLNNGDVLDTPEEGVLDGSLTVVAPSVATATINNDKLTLVGAEGAGAGQAASNQITRLDGMLLTLKTLGHAKIGDAVDASSYLYDTPSKTTLIGGILLTTGNLIKVRDGASDTSVDVGTFTQDVTYELAFAFSLTEIFSCIKGGTEFPEWTLLFIGEESTSSFCLVPSIYYASPAFTEFSGITLPEKLYPAFGTPFISDAFNGSGALAGQAPDIGGGVWAQSRAPYLEKVSGEARLINNSTFGGDSLPVTGTKIYAVSKVRGYSSSSVGWQVTCGLSTTNTVWADIVRCVCVGNPAGSDNVQIVVGEVAILDTSPTVDFVNNEAIEEHNWCDGVNAGGIIKKNGQTFSASTANASAPLFSTILMDKTTGNVSEIGVKSLNIYNKEVTIDV